LCSRGLVKPPTVKQRYQKLRAIYTKGTGWKKPSSFNLTEEQFSTLLQEGCAYGDSKDGDLSDQGLPILLSLDRIDNQKGHDWGNVVASCSFHNGVRNEYLSVEEMKIIAQTIPRLSHCGQSLSSQRLKDAHARKYSELLVEYEKYRAG
jgi:hypothetical protein